MSQKRSTCQSSTICWLSGYILVFHCYQQFRRYGDGLSNTIQTLKFSLLQVSTLQRTGIWGKCSLNLFYYFQYATKILFTIPNIKDMSMLTIPIIYSIVLSSENCNCFILIEGNKNIFLIAEIVLIQCVTSFLKVLKDFYDLKQ